jgi:hypothetical protein
LILIKGCGKGGEKITKIHKDQQRGRIEVAILHNALVKNFLMLFFTY